MPTATVVPHASGIGDGGRLVCNACGLEWPCRTNLLWHNGQLAAAASSEYHRHNAAVEEQEALRLRMLLRYERTAVIPLAIVAVLEFGILVGLWVAR